MLAARLEESCCIICVNLSYVHINLYVYIIYKGEEVEEEDKNGDKDQAATMKEGMTAASAHASLPLNAAADLAYYFTSSCLTLLIVSSFPPPSPSHTLHTGTKEQSCRQ